MKVEHIFGNLKGLCFFWYQLEAHILRDVEEVIQSLRLLCQERRMAMLH